jgi:hypothetical protein
MDRAYPQHLRAFLRPLHAGRPCLHARTPVTTFHPVSRCQPAASLLRGLRGDVQRPLPAAICFAFFLFVFSTSSAASGVRTSSGTARPGSCTPDSSNSALEHLHSLRFSTLWSTVGRAFPLLQCSFNTTLRCMSCSLPIGSSRRSHVLVFSIHCYDKCTLTQWPCCQWPCCPASSISIDVHRHKRDPVSARSRRMLMSKPLSASRARLAAELAWACCSSSHTNILQAGASPNSEVH